MHHRWICSPGRIVAQRFDEGPKPVGVGFLFWQLIEETLGEVYLFDGMTDSNTWVWSSGAPRGESQRDL